MRFCTSSAEGRRPQALEDLLLALLGLVLELAPGGLLDLAARLAAGLAGRRRPQLAHPGQELVTLAQQSIDAAEGVDHLAGERELLLLGELLLVDVDDVLHGGVA